MGAEKMNSSIKTIKMENKKTNKNKISKNDYTLHKILKQKWKQTSKYLIMIMQEHQ